MIVVSRCKRSEDGDDAVVFQSPRVSFFFMTMVLDRELSGSGCCTNAATVSAVIDSCRKAVGDAADLEVHAIAKEVLVFVYVREFRNRE